MELTGVSRINDEVKRIVKKLDLVSEFNYYNRNAVSWKLPYHNKFHTYCMVKNCYEAAIELGLPFQDTRILITAAIFHDFNHTGGKLTDAENISIAIKAYSRFLEEYNKNIIDEYLKTCVVRLIQITEYPFKQEPEFIEEKIIRDADLMQMFEPEWFDHVIIGLSKELLRKDSFTTEELIDTLKKNEEFLSKQKIYTKWGLKKFNLSYIRRVTSEKIKELELELIKNKKTESNKYPYSVNINSCDFKANYFDPQIFKYYDKKLLTVTTSPLSPLSLQGILSQFTTYDSSAKTRGLV